VNVRSLRETLESLVVCPPARHAKLTGTKSSGTSEASSTGHQRGPNKWEDESLGWLPEPKGKYTQFSNTILQFCLVSTTPFGRTALIRAAFAKSLFRKENVNGKTKKVSRR